MSQQNEETAVEQLVQHVKEYALSRAKDVERGAETPQLAALLVQKYGRGMVDAVAMIYGSPRVADPIANVVDDETTKLDPQWREHARERWAARPADVLIPRP